jgi:hypothetical protein
MAENWIEINKAIAKYGRQIINGCTVKHDRGIIYIDIDSDRGSLENNVFHQAESKLNSQEKRHD